MTIFSLRCSSLLDPLLPDDGARPRIAATFPEDGEIAAGLDIQPWILFDRLMDREKTQAAFRLSSDSTSLSGALEGIFEWQSNRLLFRPRRPLSPVALYSMSLEKSAESRDGIDLENDLLIHFHAGSDLQAPTLLSSDPANGAIIDVEAQKTIRLNFSEEMDFATISAGISIDPSFIYTARLGAGGSAIDIIPASPLTPGIYDILIGSSLQDLAGNPLEEEQELRFTVGNDFESPSITSASIGAISLLAGLTVAGAERKEQIELLFSEPMSPPESEEAAQIQPFAAFEKIWEDGDQKLILSFLELAPETTYQLSIDTSAVDLQKNPLDQSYHYKFHTDGPLSQRPRVTQVEQVGSSAPGGIDGASASETATPLQSLDYLDTTQLIDEDESSGTDFALYLKISFDRPMILTQLISNVSFQKIIDLTSTRIEIHSLTLGADGRELLLRLQGNPFDATGIRDIPIWKLKIDAAAEDENSNSLGTDYELFLSY